MTVGDLLQAAALEVGAVQLGEPLDAAEAQSMLQTTNDLLDSMTLERANIHTIIQRSYPITGSLSKYTMGLSPNAPQLTVSSVTNANPAVLTLAVPHGIAIGATNSVGIAGGMGLWQAINGNWVCTALGTNTLSIPLNTSALGSVTGTLMLQIGGIWDAIRPTKISTINLLYSSGVLTPIFPIGWEEYSGIALTIPPQPQSGVVISPNPVVTGPPLKAYCDYENPLATIYLYPEPDQDYYVVLYSEEALSKFSDLSDNLVVAPGYARYYKLNIAVECADALGVTASPAVLEKLRKAELAVKSKNRKAPNLITDPSLIPARNNLYNYRLGMTT